jgi:DNA-binding response OmpR family regulator
MRGRPDRAPARPGGEGKTGWTRNENDAEGRRILVVDDDSRYRDLLQLSLTRRGYTVQLAHDGLAALNLLERERVDLVILDLMLPDFDGYDLCRRIREHYTVPIVILTARSEPVDRVRGLALGADDYVVKPFWTDELLARVWAVLRRSDPAPSSLDPPFVSGDLSIDYSQRRVTVRNGEVRLTPQEYRLLYHLARSVGRTLVHEELVQLIWGAGYGEQTALLHTTIRRLRRKLEEDPSAPRYILTRRGIGYVLSPPATRSASTVGSAEVT